MLCFLPAEDFPGRATPARALARRPALGDAVAPVSGAKKFWNCEMLHIRTRVTPVRFPLHTKAV